MRTPTHTHVDVTFLLPTINLIKTIYYEFYSTLLPAQTIAMVIKEMRRYCG